MALQDGASVSRFHRDFGTQLVLLAHLASALNSAWSGEGQTSQARERRRTVTKRVCVSTSETEPHCHERDPRECHLQQCWPSEGLSTAGAPCSALPLSSLHEKREGPQEAQQLSKKEKKLINSVSCPEPGKESKQPVLQMTLLPASCREVSIFPTKTGAEGKAGLQGPIWAVVANSSCPQGLQVPAIFLRAPNKVSLP